jgi:hypothetical protein
MIITKQELPPLNVVKEQAKALRSALSTAGTIVSHSKSLELIAHQFGFKDWNTLHATIGNRPAKNPITIGRTVSGRYLGQPFSAEIIGVRAFQASNRFRLTLNLDVPIDVVTFDSFSSFRKRIHCTVDQNGVSTERTSNGKPQMVLELVQ